MSKRHGIALLLALVTLAIFASTRHFEFSSFDDNDYVTNNPMVQGGLNWNSIYWAFTTGKTGNWIPLTWISHMAVCQWFGLNPGAHHLANVLFHTANVVILFFLLLRLTGAIWPSTFATALFAWHPLHVESVAWISERKDMLSTFFGFLALYTYAGYVQSKQAVATCRKNDERDRQAKRSRYNYLATLAWFTGSLMSKPMLVTLPFVMLLLDFWPLQRAPIQKSSLQAWKTLVFEKWPFFLLSLALCLITYHAQHAGGYVTSLSGIPLGDRLENIPVAHVRYLLQMVWPVNLIAFYTFPMNISLWIVGSCVLFLLLITIIFWRVRDRAPYWLIGWLCFLGTLVPVNGLVTFGGQAMANRFTYFPTIGIFLALALGGRDLAKRLRFRNEWVAGTAGVAIVACLTLTSNQLRYWHDDVALFSHVIENTKDNQWMKFRDTGIIHNHLGFALEQHNRDLEALVEYHAALTLRPYYLEALNNLGAALLKQSRFAEASQQFELALKIDPNHPEVLRNLGFTLAQQGQLAEAIHYYQQAITTKPDYAEAHFDLAVALDGVGQAGDALQHYQRAIQLKPNYAEAHNNLGLAFLRAGRIEEALAELNQSIRLKPDNLPAYNNLGMALISQGKYAEAIEKFNQAIEIDPTYAKAYRGMAVALLKQGKTNEAQSKLEQALQQAIAKGNQRLADSIRAQMQTFPSQ
jgi:protein O-mannosyl-transferase